MPKDFDSDEYIYEKIIQKKPAKPYSFALGFLRGATGIGPEIAAATSAGVEQQLRAFGAMPQLVEAQEGKVTREQFAKERLEDYLSKIRQEEKQAGGWGTVGQIAGLMSPVGVFAGGAKIAGKGLGMLGKYAPRLAKSKLMQSVAKGIGGTVASEQVEELGREERFAPEKLPGQIAKGTAAGIVGRGVEKGIEAISRVGMPSFAKKLVGKVREFGQREGKHETGEAVETGLKTARGALSESYRKTVEPVLERHGNKTISVEGFRKHVTNLFKKKGLIDERGNILEEKFSEYAKYRAKGPLYQQLRVYIEQLRKNPTLSQMDDIVDDLQARANFGSKVRTAEEKIYGKMSKLANEDLMSGIKEVGGPEGLKAIESATKQFAGKVGAIEEGMTKVRPGVSWVRNMRPKDFGIVYNELDNATREVVKGGVINDIFARSTNPASGEISISTFLKSIDSYDDTLKLMFDKSELAAINQLKTAMEQLGIRGLRKISSDSPTLGNILSGIDITRPYTFPKAIARYVGGKITESETGLEWLSKLVEAGNRGTFERIGKMAGEGALRIPTIIGMEQRKGGVL